MDENPENQNESFDEELELDLELDGEEEATTTDKKDRIIKSLLARAKKAEAKAKAVQPRINKEEPKQFQIDEEVELRLDGYTKDEAKFILNNGGRKTLEDKNSYVAVAINTIREQKKAEQAAMAVEDTSALSEVERKYTPEQLQNMSIEDLRKVLPTAD